MKECPRCGFLNPDKAEYCIKCRYLMGAPSQISKEQSGPVPDEEPEITSSPLKDEELYATPLEPGEGSPGESVFDVGGYGIGGTVRGKISGPPPSDAFALMTGGDALSPGEQITRKKAKKVRAVPMQGLPKKKRVAKEKAAPGGIPYPLTKQIERKGAKARAFPIRPSIPGVDILSRIRDYANPKNIVTTASFLLAFFAFIYILIGGSYFAKTEDLILEKAQSAMGSLYSVHINAEIQGESEKKGAFTGNLQIDLLKNGDYKGTYSLNLPEETSVKDIVVCSKKAYEKGFGENWKTTSKNLPSASYLSSLAFLRTSSARLLDEQPLDGIPIKHIAFTGDANTALALIPDSEAKGNARVYVEVWIESESGLMKHMRITASGLYHRRLGNFKARAEVGYSNLDARIEITQPQ